MKIVDVKVQSFNYKNRIVRDEDGHTHPGPEHDARQTMLTIVSDEGAEGYSFSASADVMVNVVKPAILNEDPFDRELIWQRLKQHQRSHRTFTDRELGAVEMALWDLAGRHLNTPVYKLLGGYRDKILAYASTMCGDEMAGGLSSPDDYGKFAEWCMHRGYKAFKLHTWMPPIEWAPDPKMDVKACAAVREAVGPDIPLMLDSYHHYSREQAYYIGRELEKLNYHWFEEPMDEHSMSSYKWLTDQLDIAIVGPETAEGKMQTRAEWMIHGVSDISRAGVSDVGGISPVMKIVHLAESMGVAMEVHGGGAGNLQALGAMGIPGEFYERGLLHPFIDYDEVEPWLNAKIDFMDEEGYVHLPKGPGLGYDINFDYIRGNSV